MLIGQLGHGALDPRGTTRDRAQDRAQEAASPRHAAGRFRIVIGKNAPLRVAAKTGKSLSDVRGGPASDHTVSSSPMRSMSFSMLNGFFTNSSAPALRSSLISSWFTTPETMMIFMCSKLGFERIVWQTTLPLMSGSM